MDEMDLFLESLPNGRSLDLPRLKAFADEKIYVTQKMKLDVRRVENIVWLPAFSRFPTMFSKGFFLRDIKSVAFWLIVVAGLWGVTNPFIKRGSQGIESIKASTPLKQFVAELQFLTTNWKYIVPFLINQTGSVVYYLTLSSADLSLAVPITNSLTFIFTGVTGHLLGEKISSKKTLAGMLLVVAGVTFCVMDKI